MAEREDPAPPPAPPSSGSQDASSSGGLSPSEELLRLPVPPEALPIAALAGARIGHFRVLNPIGRGGMSVVYRAADETLRRDVALKVLPPSYASDAERRRRLLREARSTAAVNHPNIATIYEVGEADGRVYIAMELVRGQNLSQILAQGRLGIEETIRIALQVLRGLQKAHEAGLIHRDLKPDNVMLTGDGLAKVLDFGLAKQRALDFAESDVETVTHMTVDGRLLGTPLYMSPEQARGVELDHRSDLFSFGVVLYQMLTERRPFSGATTADLLTAILRDDPPDPRDLCPEMPAALSSIVMRCLAKKPDDRYPDCERLIRDLEQLLPAGQGSSVSSLGERRAAPARGPELERPRRALSPWKVVLAGASLASLAFFAAIGAGARPWPKSPPPSPVPEVIEAPAPRPTALTDLQLPSSKSPVALAAYTEAVQALRDGNWGQTEASLQRAISLDPLLAAAHLRLAMVNSLLDPDTEARARYENAVRGRASLSDRDQVLLRALEPVLGRDPPERAVAVQRLREATQRFPLDAEFFATLAWFETDDEASMSAAHRATELDPQYADAWQALGDRLAFLDRVDEALAAFDRCLSISPATTDCQGARARLYGRMGRCAAMEEGARRAITSASKAAPDWYEARVVALHALGRPAETVLEAFLQKWEQIPVERRRPTELLDRARIDIEAGRFDDAEARLREGNQLIRSNRNAPIHAMYALRLVDVYAETGRLREAAKVADDYLKRKDVWVGLNQVRGVTIRMLRTLLHAGALSKEAFASARKAWFDEGPKEGDTDPGRLWLYAYTGELEQREEADEALAAFAQLPPGALSPMYLRWQSARIGQMYLLAGRPDEALPRLDPKSLPCRGPGDTSPDLPLGQALEQKGDKEGACAAYAAVLDRWGDARPRSITADKAKARARALGCAERKAGAIAVPWLTNRVPT